MPKNHIRLTSGLAAVTVAAGLAAGAQTASAADDASPYRVKVRDGALLIAAHGRGADLALRLAGDEPAQLQIDVDADGSADLTVARSRFDRIDVDAGRGDQTVHIDDSGGPLAVPVTIDGGSGDDTLLGGIGAETLLGGAGDDVVDGNGGADHADLGDGADTFRWDPGDGSDVVDGQTGSDTLVFNGSNASERFDVFAVGRRVLFTRDVGSIHMDLDGIERIDTAALGGSDRFAVADLTGTSVTSLRTDLAGLTGPDDVAADAVLVSGTAGADVIDADGATGTVAVTGLAAEVDIVNAVASQDVLTLDGGDGDDVLDGAGLAADAIGFAAFGGNGDDVLLGGAGADVLNGGEGDDVLNGGPGLDTLDGGRGANVVIQG